MAESVVSMNGDASREEKGVGEEEEEEEYTVDAPILAYLACISVTVPRAGILPYPTSGIHPTMS